MTKKILLALAALAALTLSFSSCHKDNKGDDPKKPTDVKLVVKPESVSVMVGKTVALEIKTQPANAEYTCISKDPAVATVDAKGVITGVKVGETTVTVTAGTVTKDVAVKVTPLVEVKDDMYIGLYNDGLEKYIPAIYMPYTMDDLTKSKQQEIVYAMTSKGWEFTHYSNDKNSDVAFLFVAPENKFNDWRMLDFAYYHTPSKGKRFCVGTQSAWKIDPLRPTDQLTDDEKKLQDMIITVAKAYGFTEGLELTNLTNKGKWSALAGYNLSRGDDKPLNLLAYAEPSKTDKGEAFFRINFQISWYGPEKESSLATRTVRPVLEDNLDLSMLLRKNK